MASYYRAPDPLQSTQLIPGGNTPASACLLFTYVAGSSTKQTVYKDNAGNAAWSNPIVLDSGGNLPNNGSIWIPTGVTIDAVLAPSNDSDPPSSPYWTKEDISGINDVNASVTDWINGPTPVFVSGTQFVLTGDQSATFKGGRRIRSTNTGGTVYGSITSVIASAGSTTVNTVSDAGGALDSGLSDVAYSLIDPALQSINDYYIDKKAMAVASAGNGTTNIWGIAGNFAHITGTNTTRNFSTAPYAGAVRNVMFDGVLTLVTSASISIPGNQNISTAAGDMARVIADTVSTAVIASYTRASVIPHGRQPTRTVLSTVTSATYTTPAGVQRIDGRLVAGGAGGGGAPATAGTNGSSTIFGAFNAGGGSSPTTGNGAGGHASTGTLGIQGGDGQGGINNSVANVFGQGGQGGSSPFGGAGGGGQGNQNGTAAKANSGSGGGGGGGASAQNSAGGGGAGGYVEFSITSPATSYAYTVGAGGTGGVGASLTGGNGGSGVIILDEFYD